MRAKFKVNSITDHGNNYKVAKLTAVYCNKNNSENNTFSQATPTGELTISISNPTTVDFLKVTKEYYLDFTEAPDNS